MKIIWNNIKIYFLLFWILLGSFSTESKAQETSIVLKNGEFKELTLENVKSVRVGNSRIVEVKRQKDSQQLIIYPIKSGRTDIVVKYKDNRPPQVIQVEVQGEDMYKQSQELQVAFSSETELSILPLDGKSVLQGKIKTLKSHELALKLVKEGLAVATYQFNQALCHETMRNIELFLKSSQWGDFKLIEKNNCHVYLRGMTWQSELVNKYLLELQNLYQPGMSIISEVIESNLWPIVIKTEVEVIEHHHAKQDKLGFIYPDQINVASALNTSPNNSNSGLSVMAPSAQAKLNRDEAKVILKPIIYTQNGQSSTFESTLDLKEQGKIGIQLTLLPKLLDENRIMTEVQVTSQNGLEKNAVKTMLLGKNGETFVLSGFNLNGLRKQSQGIWLLSDIPILGYLFKFRQDENTNKEISIVIKQNIQKNSP